MHKKANYKKILAETNFDFELVKIVLEVIRPLGWDCGAQY